MAQPADVVIAARNLLERTDAATAGLWPRATALLVRQALESALDDFWRMRAAGVERCSMRAQLLCLAHYLDDDELAESASYAWAGLSRACHQHPYELPPTSAELLGWLSVVQHLVQRVTLLQNLVTKD
jgi:hypothetical protein